MSTPKIYPTADDLPRDTIIDISSWRCGPFLREHFLSLDAIQISIVAFSGKNFDVNISTNTIHIGKLGTNIKISTFSMLRHVIKKNQKPHVKLMLTTDHQATPAIPGVIERIDGNMMSYISLLNNSIITQFVFFYETFVEFVNNKSLHDRSRLEPRWGFARVVRNAFTHGGTINIKDRALPTVFWKGISYDWTNFGEPVINNQLYAPDLIYLILDLDLALSALGHS